jgi:peptidoglycan/xylan/chitin deacetylase (PgdA/CDA1 family)
LAAVENKKEIIDDIKLFLNKNREECQLESFDYYYNKQAHKSIFDSADVIFIKRLLQVELAEKVRGMIIDELFNKYIGVPESVIARELYMNTEQIMHMQRSGMHIGCHGYNHYWWNHLAKLELENELDRSVEFLSAIGVNMNNWTAAYPYGSFDEQSVSMLAKKGCKLAVTTQVAIATTKMENRFLLPRIDTNHITDDMNNGDNHWYSQA